MYLQNSSKSHFRGLIGASSSFLLCLIFLSAMAQPSSGQTSTQALPMGVKVGDTFSFKVLQNDTSTQSYMIYELLNDPNLHPSDVQLNQFEITITGFGANNSRYCYYNPDYNCNFYDPIIQLTYTSGTITHANSEIYAGPFGGQLIVTNDWTFMEQHANLSLDFPHSLLSNFTQTNTFEIQGSNTVIMTQVGWYYNQSIADANFLRLNGYQMLGSVKSIYDTKTGVMNYVQSNRSFFYPDGNIGNHTYEVINKSYHTAKVKVPLANPIPFLIFIALVRKRRLSSLHQK